MVERVHAESYVALHAKPCGCVCSVLVKNRARDPLFDEIYVTVNISGTDQHRVFWAVCYRHLFQHSLECFVAHRVVFSYLSRNVLHYVLFLFAKLMLFTEYPTAEVFLLLLYTAGYLFLLHK